MFVAEVEEFEDEAVDVGAGTRDWIAYECKLSESCDAVIERRGGGGCGVWARGDQEAVNIQHCAGSAAVRWVGCQESEIAFGGQGMDSLQV